MLYIGDTSGYPNGSWTCYLGYCFMQKAEGLVALGNMGFFIYFFAKHCVINFFFCLWLIRFSCLHAGCGRGHTHNCFTWVSNYILVVFKLSMSLHHHHQSLISQLNGVGYMVPLSPSSFYTI